MPPYRSGGRSDEAYAEREAELTATLEGATLRVRAAAGALKQLEARLADERRALDEAVDEAEAELRRALHAGMARGVEPKPELRDALRARGAIGALERAMAGAKRRERPVGASERAAPDPSAAKQALSGARRRRAELYAKQQDALTRARDRLADAVAAHDALALELEDLRAARDALSRS